MKMKILSGTMLALVLFITASAQTLDKSKLDQLFDRLLERNKGIGSLS